MLLITPQATEDILVEDSHSHFLNSSNWHTENFNCTQFIYVSCQACEMDVNTNNVSGAGFEVGVHSEHRSVLPLSCCAVTLTVQWVRKYLLPWAELNGGRVPHQVSFAVD